MSRSPLMRGAVLVTILTLSSTAWAQCEFDAFGTISNPNQPICRDARFEFTESAGGAGNIPIGYPVPVGR